MLITAEQICNKISVQILYLFLDLKNKNYLQTSGLNTCLSP
jgi:hypothetical protein